MKFNINKRAYNPYTLAKMQDSISYIYLKLEIHSCQIIFTGCVQKDKDDVELFKLNSK